MATAGPIASGDPGAATGGAPIAVADGALNPAAAAAANVPPPLNKYGPFPPGSMFRVLPDGTTEVLPPAGYTGGRPPAAAPGAPGGTDTYATGSTQALPAPSSSWHQQWGVWSAPPQQAAAPGWPGAAAAPAGRLPTSATPYTSYGSGSGADASASWDVEAQRFDAAESLGRKGRLEFVRRVYTVLSVQLLVTFGFVLLCSLHDGVRSYIQTHPGMFYASIIIMFVVLIGLACVPGVAQSSPLNIILLGIFTLSMAYLMGMTTSFFSTTIVMQAILITAAITVGLTIYAFTTKRDITKWGTFLFAGLIVLILGGLLRLIFPWSPVMDTIWAAFGALLFAMYLIYDTFMLIHVIPPDQYIAAALMLYLDIVNMFLYILRLTSLARSD